jgi:hypothetical protein
MTCDRCGTNNPDEAIFCGNCGQALAAAPPVVTGVAALPVSASHVPPSPDAACLVCGHVLAAYETACPRCGTPRGTRIDPDAPVSAAANPVAPAIVSGNGSGTRGSVPEELLGGWNWGAFWLPVLWGLSHNSPQTLWIFALWGLSTLVSIPLSLILPNAALGDYTSMLVTWPGGIALGIWFGRRGNEWAWRNRRFESVEHFRQVQRVWASWSIGLMSLTIGMALVALVLLATGLGHAARLFP